MNSFPTVIIDTVVSMTTIKAITLLIIVNCTTSVDINTRCNSIQSLVQNHLRHVRSESAREQRIELYKSYE